MIKIKNLTNTPYELTDVDGKKTIVPAMGEITGKFDGEYLNLLIMCGAFEVVEKQADSKKQANANESSIDDLKSEYHELTGKKPNGKWGAERLLSEVEKLRAADSAPGTTDDTEA